MLIPYDRVLSVEERKHLDAVKELLRAVEGDVTGFIANHRQNSTGWYPHEVVPWGRGQDYIEVPWREEHNSLRPEIVVALETNLLTEDNLPYYHAQIERMLTLGGPWQEWNRLWTAEENVHGAALRDYLYLMRVMDPVQIEDNRYGMMETGFDRHFKDPLEIFTYTAAQELATRVSHLRTGQKADEPVVLKLLTLIARDENFHFVFYRSVVSAMLKLAPELVLPAMMNQLYSFEMPGSGMTNFELRKAMIADAGIYGAREHRDMVIAPLLRFWAIDKLTGLSPETQKVQERILRLEKVLDRMVERQERSSKKTD